MQHACIERKNGSLRRELLNAFLYYSLNDAIEMCEMWEIDYNEERPHKALNYLSPINYGQWMKNSRQLYPQSANENQLQIEESRLVDKAEQSMKIH
jgi:putative transposase